MTLQELREHFRIDAGDTIEPYLWPDELIDRLFNEAEEEAAIRGKLIRDNDEIDVFVGESVLDLPVALFDIRHAELRDAAGGIHVLASASRDVLDEEMPGWRSATRRPEHFVHDDKTLLLGTIPDADYTLYIEFFRTPERPMRDPDDAPEIHQAHHRALVQWVLYRAYSIPDADGFNPEKAKAAEALFVRSFGKRPDSDLRRRQNVNRHHRNRLHL